MKAKDSDDAKVIQTVCMMTCGTSCGVLAHVKNGVLTKVEPADFPEPGWRYACRRSLASPKILYHPDRLKYPLKRVGERGEGQWQRISWDEALDTIAGRLKDIEARYGPESLAIYNGGVSFPTSGIWSGPRFASASGSTMADPFGCALNAQFCADMSSYGNQWGESYQQDHENPRMCVLWGSNAVTGFSWRYRRRTRPAREKGAKMVVISPLFTPTAAKADQWIPIRPSTDVVLVLGMINLIMSEGLCDEAFLIEHTIGPFLVRGDNGLYLREEHISTGESTNKYVVWDTQTNKPRAFDTPGSIPALRGSYRVNEIECKPAFQLLAEMAEQYPLEKTSEITDIAPDVIKKLALDYATLRPVVSDRGLSLARAFHGDLAHRAITTLAAITGNICLNIQQSFFEILNWAPFLFPGGRVHKQMSSFQFYHNHLTGKPYPIKALWVSTVNPANSAQDSNNIRELLSSMEFIVVVDLVMSATAEYADIVLPGCTTFECTSLALPWGGSFGGGNPYFQLHPKMIEPYYESKSDLEIFNELARRMGLGEFFDKSAEEYIEMLLSSGHPSMEGITLENLRKGPLKPKPYSPPNIFNTPSGRLEFYVEKLKEFGQELPVYIESPESPLQPLAQKYPLSFLQTHGNRGRHHTHGAEVNWLRALDDPDATVDMNPVDAEKRGIRNGDMVTVFNDRGRVKLKARTHEGIRPGVVTINEGWMPKDFAEGHYQELTATVTNPAQEAVCGSMGQIQGALVEVQKVGEE